MKNITSTAIQKGEFVALSVGSDQILIGSSGTLLTITPPTGQRIRITGLAATETTQTNITLSFGGTDIITNQGIAGNDPSSTAFSIGSYFPYAAGPPPSGNHKYITGKVDEEFIVTKVSGSTSVVIAYSYEFGE